MFSPAVITSRAAQKDFDTIRAKHADLLIGLANQSTKVQQHTMQKQAEMQTQATMKHEMQKERMVADIADKKNAMDFQMKQAELDVKRAALSAAE